MVALEEQVLQLKSSHLKDRSQASGASEVARAMQVWRTGKGVSCTARKGWRAGRKCVWDAVALCRCLKFGPAGTHHPV